MAYIQPPAIRKLATQSHTQPKGKGKVRAKFHDGRSRRRVADRRFVSAHAHHHRRHHRGRLPIRRELSAGGVAVREEAGQWLVALLRTEHKRGMVWVLPKGHVEMDQNEAIPDAAKREVSEEAGLTDLSVKNELGITRFQFQVEDAVVHKTVHYFLMQTNQKKIIPQAEEGLLEGRWFPLDEAIRQLEYDTDQDIVARARAVLTGQPMPKRRATSSRSSSRPRPRRRHIHV